ncbi:hypothetical protein L5G28_07570 [Gordonia sp. HY285]|uniref:hypothetical protein n=1 Tax=Gordonia liuliyuniae TaxID=2911517 RepID=UPI001F299047|nr:hypothetical protein [Gordonia liuliyuniae]MCF8610019.1 hypothetical protein [Gordonia liuliyuniae]
MSSDITREARELLDGTTAGEWRASLLDGVQYEDGSSSYRGGAYPVDHGSAPIFLTNSIDKRDADFIASSPRLVRELLAENEQLQQWKAEAGRVMAELQELGQALGLPLGSRITGTEAAAKVRKLLAKNERLAARCDHFADAIEDDGNAWDDSQAWAAWFAAERDEWQRRAYEAAGEALDHQKAHKQVLAALDRVRLDHRNEVWDDTLPPGGVVC